MNVQLVELAVFLLIEVGFWYRFAAPALRRAQAPEHVRRAILGVTLSAGVGIVLSAVCIVSGLGTTWLVSVLSLPSLAWLLVVLAGWPSYRRLTRAVAWFDARQRRG